MTLAATTMFSVSSAQAHVKTCEGRSSYTLCAIHHWRDAVWRIEDRLGAPHTRYGWTAERKSAPAAYRLWVRHLWYTRWHRWRHRFESVYAIPSGILSGLLCIHPKESVDWHLNGGLGPQVSGGLQIALTTWEANGGLEFAPAAYLATPQQQLVVGMNIALSSGWGAWPISSVECGL